MDEPIKPSNSQLADKVADYAAKLFFEERGYGMSLAEQGYINGTVYGCFNSAVAAHVRKLEKRTA